MLGVYTVSIPVIETLCKSLGHGRRSTLPVRLCGCSLRCSASSPEYFRDTVVSYVHYYTNGSIAPVVIDGTGVGTYRYATVDVTVADREPRPVCASAPL